MTKKIALKKPRRTFEEYLGFRINPANIDKALDTLTPREELIIRRFFGIPPYERETLISIGKNFAVGCSVSSERIRQIRNKAIKRLRHPTRKALLQNWLLQTISDKGE